METFFPPEIHFARPRAKTIMARVTMNGCILNRAIKPPEAAPKTAPAPRHARMARPGGHPNWRENSENSTADNPSRLPTDRSIPAVMMTRVIPQARIPKTDICLSISRCVPHLKKVPSALNTAPKMKTNTSGTSAALEIHSFWALIYPSILSPSPMAA